MAISVLRPGDHAREPPQQVIHHLPRPLSRFIGREQEIAAVRALLSTQLLVTITGAGGAGKTRLALEAAARMPKAFPDGIWFVDLSTITDGVQVAPAIAAALQVRDEPRRDMRDVLCDLLRTKQLLLILDNCEHVIAECAALGEWLLTACTDLHLLVTSREPLGVRGEATWQIPPMALPEAVGGQTGDDPAASEAVQLFVERARTVHPGFQLTPENGAVVARICRNLDGLPLAIELAAARVRMMSLTQIAARLDHALRLLTDGSRTALPRQQTLRATMDWSYALLDDAERRLLRRLAVFAGGWALEAAEEICATDGTAHVDVLDALTHLIDKSLLVAETPPSALQAARYRLLETIRQYGMERLEEADEAEATRDRHLDHYRAAVTDAAPLLQGAAQAEAMAGLETERANLRTALDWALARGEGESALAIVGGLWRFWHGRGEYAEGRRWLEEALTHPCTQRRTVLRARALLATGSLATVHGDYAAARVYLEASLSIWQEHDDAGGKAYALSELGWLPMAHDDIAAMRQMQTESLALFRAVGDRWGEARALGRIGWTAFQESDATVARRYFTESIARWRPLGDKLALAEALRDLGELARFEGAHDEAAALYQETTLLAQELGNLNLYAQGLGSLASIALAQGDARKAMVLGVEALRIIVQRQGNTQSIYSGLAGTAGAAIVLGHLELAARLSGAAETMRDAHGLTPYPADQARYKRDLVALQRALDAVTLHAAWEEGRSLTPEQAVALADATLAPAGIRAVGQTTTPPGRSDYMILSRREAEVVRQIAQGRSNREIAEALFIAPKTVEMHVSNSLSKLGFRSRSQLAAWAAVRESADRSVPPAPER